MKNLLCGMVFLVACGGAAPSETTPLEAPVAQEPRDPIELLAPDSEVVGHADFARLRAAPVFARLKQLAPAWTGLFALAAACDDVYVGANDDTDGAAVCRLPREGSVEALRNLFAEGGQVVEVVPPPVGATKYWRGGQGALAQFTPTFAAFGREERVQEVMARYRAPNGSVRNLPRFSVAGAISFDAAMVAVLGPKPDDAATPCGLRIEATAGLSVDAACKASSPERATADLQSLQERIGQAARIASLFGMGQILERVQFASGADMYSAHVDASAEEVERLVTRFGPRLEEVFGGAVTP